MGRSHPTTGPEKPMMGKVYDDQNTASSIDPSITPVNPGTASQPVGSNGGMNYFGGGAMKEVGGPDENTGNHGKPLASSSGDKSATTTTEAPPPHAAEVVPGGQWSNGLMGISAGTPGIEGGQHLDAAGGIAPSYTGTPSNQSPTRLGIAGGGGGGGDRGFNGRMSGIGVAGQRFA